MAIESIQETQAHAQFTANRSGHNWTCPYTVTVSSPRVGPLEIVNYFNHTVGRGIDSRMVYADETDPFAFCDSIAPVKRDRSGTVWDVTLLYSTPTAGDEERDQRDWRDRFGQPTRNPFEWVGDMDIGTDYVQVPVWKAWNEDAFPLGGGSGPYTRDYDTLGPVVNSAGIVLDPPLMTEVGEQVIRVVQNVSGWDDDWPANNENHISGTILKYSDALRANFDVAGRQFDTYTLKCTSVRGSYAQATVEDVVIPYWKVAVELRYRRRASPTYPFDGWLESVLDRGLSRAAVEGYPNGQGGQYSSDDFEDGMAHVAPARGPDGDRTGELVLLDGAGMPLDPSDDRAKTGVYCRWRVHPWTDFQGLPFNILDYA